MLQQNSTVHQRVGSCVTKYRTNGTGTASGQYRTLSALGIESNPYTSPQRFYVSGWDDAGDQRSSRTPTNFSSVHRIDQSTRVYDILRTWLVLLRYTIVSFL